MTRLVALALFASVVAALAGARPAAAEEPPRLVYLGGDAELRRALELGLEPWGVVVVSSGEAPPVDLEGAEERAGLVFADALVWIAPVDGTPSLHVYDATVRQIVVRRLAIAPPFDAPTAAAVALTVKTVLRLGRVAPEGERADESFVPAAAGAAATRRAVTPRWRLEGALATRFAGGAAELRNTIALGWRPGGGPLVLAAGVALGPGVAVDVPEFAGRHTGTTLAAGARWRLGLGAAFLEPGLGLSLTRATLDGVALAGDTRAHVVRWNPGGVVGLALGARTANLELAVTGDAGVAFRRQRFLLGGMPLHELPVVDWTFGLRLSVSIP